MDFSRPHPNRTTGKKFYPVIHAEDIDAVQHNAAVAFEAGADGIFLINHSFRADNLLQIYSTVRREFSTQFIGINLLDQSAVAAFRLMQYYRDVDALWVDNSGIGDTSTKEAERLRREMRDSDWPGQYFASTAFKHQQTVRDVAEAARLTSRFAHVVVTSGLETGTAPDATKIILMKMPIHDFPLAIASGMTVDNIRVFLPHADIFMVATGISQDFTTLDPIKTKQMVNIIALYNQTMADR